MSISSIKLHQRRSNVAILLAIICFVVILFIDDPATRSLSTSTAILLMLSGVFFILGCGEYAAAKGRTAVWGLLRLLGPIGLLFLVLGRGSRARPS